MEFIPYAKMSKKQKSTYNKQKRVTWGFSPVERVKPSKKVYQRQKVRISSVPKDEDIREFP